MTKILNYPMSLNLQLFAEGAGDGGTGSEGATGVTPAAAEQGKKGVSNSLENVVYGKQEIAEPAAEVHEETTTEQKIDRNAEFDKLIKGEYKDLFDAKMQDTMQKRLGKLKEVEGKYNSLIPALEQIAAKYGVESTDIEALTKAIEEDDSYYEQEALEKGITVQQLKSIRKMERENAELRQQMQEQESRDNANKLYAKWMQQEQEIKGVYPTFNLEAEMQNSRFIDLLRAGVDMRTVYEVMHKDEIIHGAMQFTAQEVEKKVTNKIRANGARPTENGMSSQGAAVVKSDVSQLSNADISEVLRRVRRGEKISF